MAEESVEPHVTPEKNESSFDNTKIDINLSENRPSPSNGEFFPVPKRRASIASTITGSIPKSCHFNEEQSQADVTSSKTRVPIHLRTSIGSCHDVCKYGGQHVSKEKTKGFPSKKMSRKSLPNEANPMKKEKIFEAKATEPPRTRILKFSSKEKMAQQGLSLDVKRRSSLTSVSFLTKSCSPRLCPLSENKTGLLNPSPGNKSVASKVPEIIKKEISVSSEKVKVRGMEGGSGENKESAKRSSLANEELIKVVSNSGNFHAVQTGRKVTSSMISSSLSNIKYQKRTVKSNSGFSTKTFPAVKNERGNNALDPKARKGGMANLSSSSLNHQMGTQKSDGEQPEKTLHVIENEAENKALASSSRSSSGARSRPQLLYSDEEKQENDEIGSSCDEAVEFVSENTASIETGDIPPVKIYYSNIEANSESENLQSMKENREGTPSLASSEEDNDNGEVYPLSSSEFVSHSEAPSFSSLEQNDEEINYEGKIIDPLAEEDNPTRPRFRQGSTVTDKTSDFTLTKKPMETLRKTESSTSYNSPGTPNKTLRPSPSSICENKPQSPVNLIHRDKLMDSQTASNCPTTRLKFTSRVDRPEGGGSDSHRKTISRRGGGGNDEVGFDLSSRKVVLKHPEVQCKKAGQALLNNVIEETASKLVESRKSKVKALVGAFETVISLQEPKYTH